MKSFEALEAARCARINLDNLAKTAPGIKDANPFWKIVAMQIDSCIALLEEAADGPA